ncbi:MAG: peptidase S10 [Gemmatimonadota bacterium]
MKRGLQTALAVVAAAQLGPVAGVNGQEHELRTTQHQIDVAGRTLRYTAHAGFIPIRDNGTGEIHGQIFFVSYSLDDGEPSSQRPLTFAWNGGPGSNSVLVHLVGFGPRRLSEVGPRPSLVDNPDTWLPSTDLVFVDPIGTGFSRPARAEYADEFYNVLGDIDAVAEFIRVYRTRFDALHRPLFLAGESYGVWRAAGVAEKLTAAGQPVTGVMLISGGIPLGPVATAEQRTAMFVPNRTAAAFHHGKLPAELQRDLPDAVRQAERWARNVYAPALARRDALGTAERDEVIADLARFTGIDPASIDPTTLSMSSPEFRAALLRDEGRTAGRYDMRVTEAAEPTVRPVLVRRYLQNELEFATDLAYQGLEAGYSAGEAPPSVGARWGWNQAPPGAPPSNAGSGDGPPGGAQPWLRRAMDLDPALVAFVAAGLYDSLNSCADNAWIVEHIEPRLRANITTGCYPGGHVMYDGSEARRALAADVATFIAAAAARRSGGQEERRIR